MSGRNRLETVSLCAQHPRKNGAADAAARPGWVRPPSEHGAARAHAGRAAPRPPSRLLRVTRVAGPPRPRGLYFLLAQLIRAMRVRFAETSVSRSTPSPPGPVRCTVRTSAVVRGGIRVTARVPPHPPRHRHLCYRDSARNRIRFGNRNLRAGPRARRRGRSVLRCSKIV